MAHSKIDSNSIVVSLSGGFWEGDYRYRLQSLKDFSSIFFRVAYDVHDCG